MKYHATFGAAGTEKVGGEIRRKKDTHLSSEEIAGQVRDFLAKGGKVKHIRQGLSGLDMKLRPIKYI